MSGRRSARTAGWLWILAILVALACTWGADFVFWTVTDRPEQIGGAFRLQLFKALLIGAPFFWLAHEGSRGDHDPRRLLAAAVVGTSLTMVVHWSWFRYAYDRWQHGRSGGVPIDWAAFVMLSPVLVGVVMLAILVVGADEPPRGSGDGARQGGVDDR